MPETKYDHYAALAEQTARQLTASVENWTAFLQTAARLYKYPYHEQLMIYAQRPNATACADYDTWNKTMHRYIRRGTRGIALIDRDSETPKLKYVYDLADTGTRQNSRPVNLWQMAENHMDTVFYTLDQNYGATNIHLTDLFEEISSNLAAEFWDNHRHDMTDIVADSFLEEYNIDTIGVRFRQAVTVSTTFVLMERCGIEAESPFTHEDFLPIFDFNTPDTVAALGTAVSEISEQILRDIELSIKTYERMQTHEKQPDLHENRGLRIPEPDLAEPADETSRQVWEDAERVSEEAPTDSLEQTDSVGEAVPTPDGDRRDSEPAVGADDERADEAERRDGTDEVREPDGMGTDDEQPQSTGRRSNSRRTDLLLNNQISLFDLIPSEAEQIESIDKAEELTPSVFSVSIPDEDIEHILRLDGNTRDARMKIVTEFSKYKSTEEFAAFLQKTFHDGNGIVTDNGRYAVWYAEEGIRIAKGDSARYVTSAQVLPWMEAAERIASMLANGTYATNVEIAEMRGFETKTAASNLLYMNHDMSEEACEQFFDPSLWKGSFDDAAERIASVLDDDVREVIVNETARFAEAYAEDRSLMRYRTYAPDRILAELNELGLPRRDFRSGMSEIPKIGHFITDDEINQSLFQSGSAEGAKGRIYAYFRESHSTKEQVNFLKEEYGIGGRGPGVSGAMYSHENHSGKGISLEKQDCPEVQLNWTNVAKRVDELIRKDRFMTAQEKEQFAQLEERYASVGGLPTPNPRYAFPSPEDLTRNLQIDIPSELDRYVPIVREAVEQDTAYRNACGHSDRENAKIECNAAVRRAVLDSEDMELLRLFSDEPDFRQNLQQTVFDATYEVLHEQLRPTSQDDIDDLNFDDIDPVAIRESLAEHGIENGEMTDPDALNNSPFIRQVMDDVEQIEQGTEQKYETDTVAYYSGEENRLPYDIVVQTLRPSDPEPPPENFRITDENLGTGGAKTKFRRNMDAIHTLQQIESENRRATPEEQETLSQYVGWGGLADVFDSTKENWRNEYAELSSALSPDEYAAARSSTLNAHYTSPTVIKAIYEAIGNMGFQSGNILEPSMGVGNFFGLLPEEMRSSKLYGVELDSITGRIAKQLYPNADITVAGFETTNRRDFFDLAVGNVPFGNYKVNDWEYNKLNFNIHNYFFAKALDQVRPGGVVAFVTSRYTMDSESPTVRKYLAERADLLGAIRLPNNTFKANAGTEVTTDIIFLQKRDRPQVIEPDWVHLGLTSDNIPVNSYFVEHPEMVLGTLKLDDMMYGGAKEVTCEPIEGANLADQLHEAIRHITGTYTEVELPDLGENETIAKTIPADPNVKNYSYTVVDGDVYYRENSIMVQPELNATAKERVRGMVELRDTVQELMDLQLNGGTEGDISHSQASLNQRYDDFTAKYGLINDRTNRLAFSEDSSYYLLCSLEILNEDRTLKRKADMFTKRTIKVQETVTSVDTAAEALAVSIAEKTSVDLDFMSRLSGKSQEDLISDLRGVIFRLPESPETFVTADEYLSGNVREKLRVAQAAGDSYADNITALTAAQPKDLDASEIEVRLGSTWIDREYIKQFMFELLNPSFRNRFKIDVHYSEATGEWNISGKSVDANSVNASFIYGTERASAYRILEDTLNLRDVRIFDTVTDPDGKERRVLNAKETTLAQQKQQAIKEAFGDWIWKDPTRRETLVRVYNERFNSTKPREYNGEHIVFGGMNPEITLREHQKNAVAHILYGGNTLLAHEVGAGKTFEMVAAAMESKRLGLCSKPIFVVPNHLTEQWASEFLRLYPSADILVTTKKDFEPANRKKFCARIATGNYDAIIIGHSQFEKIPMSQARQERLLNEQITEITDGIAELMASNAERFTIKQLERTRKSLEARLAKLQASDRKDDVITFEQLGVDRLYVDEAHNYKNSFIYTKMRNVAGLSTTDAQKSADMLMKCRYTDELTGGRGIVFATGTPVSNSMTELFTMMRYLQNDTLKQKHLNHFDAWASTFGETTTAIELAPEGTGYRARTRFAKFFNLPELMNLFKEVADIKTADQLNLPTPKATYHNIVAQPSEIQKAMVQELSERASAVHTGLVDPSVDNMLKITSDGRKLGLDQRIINPDLPDEPGSKVNLCVDNIFQIWEDGKAERLTQVVFSDLSTPKARSSEGKVAAKSVVNAEVHGIVEAIDKQSPDETPFTVYEDIRQKLVERGVPKEEIAFIHDADTEVRKKELFAKVRSGSVRVLIGSTSKMGAGTNVQEKLVALHDLDCPWRPGDLEQRKGRIVRQGNMNPEVHIYRYVTNATFDAYLWQTIENKQKFIGQIMTSKSPVRACEDIDEAALSYAEVKALCAGDPRIAEKMNLDVEVAKLKLLKANHQSRQYRMQDDIAKLYPAKIEAYGQYITGLGKDKVTAEEHPHPADGFAGIEVQGEFYTDKDKAGTAILEACKNLRDTAPVPIGTYRGFAMSLALTDFGRQYILTLKGEVSHKVELGKDIRGNLIRMDNALASIPKQIETATAQLAEVQKQFDTAKAEVDKPFPQENELKEKSARLVELNMALDMGNVGGTKDVPAPTEPAEKPSILARLHAPKPVTHTNSNPTKIHNQEVL